VVDSKKCVRLSGLPSLGGEISMSVKVPRETMNGKLMWGKVLMGDSKKMQ
jgi:hypothetical protein